MKCKTHPKYRALRRPTADCIKCRLMFWWRRWLKTFTWVTVEEAKPRTRRVAIDHEQLYTQKEPTMTSEQIDKSIDETFPKQ